MSSAVAPVVGRSVLDSPLMRAHRGIAGKLRWHLNARLTRHPAVLNRLGAQLTIVDAYGAPGDTLLTAIVCRHLRERFPRLRINCLTPNPGLLQHDPNIDVLNAPESFFSVWSWYPNLAGTRDPVANLLSETFARLGWGAGPFEYRASVYLTPGERAQGRALLGPADRPVLTFNTRTKEPTKNWPIEAWRAVLAELRTRFHLVHLGDDSEPEIAGVQRLAGRLSLRESMGALSHARVHVGGVSFLMHAANGLEVPSVIIYGGRETPANSGYATNLNLYSAVPCSPCWLHESKGERCPHDLVCMNGITVAHVVAAVNELVPEAKRA
jgi:ADP-heptose:LPS heptosyltransferase